MVVGEDETHLRRMWTVFWPPGAGVLVNSGFGREPEKKPFVGGRFQLLDAVCT